MVACPHAELTCLSTYILYECSGLQMLARTLMLIYI